MLRPALLAFLLVLVLGGAPARAADGWLPPARLAGGAGADVAVNGSGAAAVVWTDADATVRAATRTPGGPWVFAGPLSTPGRVASIPHVALSDAGDALVVWLEETTGGAVVRASSGDLTRAVDLSLAGTPANPRSASAPAVVMSPNGAATVVWKRSNGAVIAVQAVARDAVGESFALPEQVSLTAGGDVQDVAAAMDGRGHTLVTWTRSEGLDVAMRRAGGTWSAPQPVPGASGGGYPPVLAVSRGGDALVAWAFQTTGFASATDVFGGGAWSAQGGLPGFPGRLRLAFDTDGTAVGMTQADVGNTATTMLGTRPAGGGAFAISPFSADGSFSNQRGLATSRDGGVLAYWTTTSRGLRYTVRPPGGTFGTVRLIAPAGTPVTAPVVARDDEGNGIAVWTQPDGVWTSAYDGAPPVFDELAVPETVLVGTPVAMRATARDRVSGVTLSWRFGDGAEGAGARVEHTYEVAGAREIVVTARDEFGNERSATRALQVLAPAAPPLTGGTPGDVDGDGFPPPQDCDETNAAIRPGAREVPGNRVDENCDGAVAPFPTVAATALLTSQFLGDRSTLLLRLRVRDLEAGDTIRLRCSGRGCRKPMNRTVSVRKATKTLDLTRYVKRVRLRPRSRIEVTITHPERVARIFAFVTRSGGTGAPQVQRRCQAPGGSLRAC